MFYYLNCDGWSGFFSLANCMEILLHSKYAKVGTERAEAILQEAKAYAKVEKIWGQVVPVLVGHGLTDKKSGYVYVAIEFLEGSELGDVAVTKEVETAALQALDAVHACRLVHGDISVNYYGREGIKTFY